MHTYEPLADASWIWARNTKPDQYRCFRRKFSLTRLDPKAAVAIAADSDFVAYLNGREIGRGQFSDLPGRKTWTEFPVGSQLRRGENVLAILVFYRGEDFMDYEAGPAGLLAALWAGPQSVVSDSSWLTAPHPAFQAGRRERMTPQTGFTFAYDARREEDWLARSFDDSAWESARIVSTSGEESVFGELLRRPLPHLEERDLPAVTVTAQGSLLRTGGKGSVAWMMARAACRAEFPWDIFANEDLRPSFGGADSFAGLKFTPPAAYAGVQPNAGRHLAAGAAEPLILRARKGVDGRYLVLDLGAETVGVWEWEVEALAGTILHLAHGEHLDNGRVRARVGGRNFADRYVCGAGRRHFQMPFRRVGARYLEIHVLGGAEVRFFALGLRPMEYPTERRGTFVSPDSLVNRIHEVAVRTLELCRHEHYEDCPWREQALYAYDSRLQALYGYYALGDYRFPEVSFSLLGQTLDENGFLALTAPGRCPVNIPVFTFTWIAAVGEHWLHSGVPALFERFRETIDLILHKALARFDAATGLYRPPESEEMWHFYEWTPGLCGVMGGDALRGGNHAGYNLHLHEAIRWMIWMLEQTREDKAARALERRRADLAKSIHSAFWDASAGHYRSQMTKSGRLSGSHELIQALALHEGIGSATSVRRVMQNLLRGGLAPCTLSGLYYLVSPMVWHSQDTREWLNGRLEDFGQRMILAGATSLWETAGGGADFDFGGSLCHGWSALPVYYHQSCVLGIRPLGPGFEHFAMGGFSPRFPECRGVIPTPSGPITVSWQKIPSGLKVEAVGPECCQPVLIPCPGGGELVASYNGQEVRSSGHR